MIENGWRFNSNSEYHNGPGVGSSQLSTLITRTPLHSITPNDLSKSYAVKLGEMIHLAVLEPDKWKKYAPEPLGDRRTKDFKEKVEHLKFAYPDSIIIDRDVYFTANEIKNRVTTSKLTSELLNGHKEMSGYFQDFDCLLRIRPDVRHDSQTIIDLKTTDDAHSRAWERKVLNYDYHLQAAFYLDVANMISGAELYKEFIWMVVETKPPFATALYRCTREWLDLGRERYKKAIEIYCACQRTNTWNGYPEEIVDLNVPAYAFYYE